MDQASGTQGLVIWRDSVCAGDDGDAPHEWVVPAADASVADVARQLQAAHYLASISGGRATWILEGVRPLAVLAQEWDTPRFLVPPDTPVWRYVDHEARPHLLVRYQCQADPDQVFAHLAADEAPPDRQVRLSENQVYRLLVELCAELGFCLHPAENRKLEADPPLSVDAFTDAVFRAEGMEPGGGDLWRQVRGLVAKAFDQAGMPDSANAPAETHRRPPRPIRGARD